MNLHLKAFFEEMYQYHHEMNQIIISYMINHEDDLSDRCKLLISHSILAHKLWVDRIEGEPFLDPFEVLPLKELILLDEHNLNQTLELIHNRDFEEMHTYKTSKGAEFGNTVQQILFQVANHFTYHRGQLNAELRAIGLTPVPSDYIFKRRSRLN